MTLKELESIVVEAFQNLDAAELEKLDDRAIYSLDFKEELIEKFQRLFKEYHLKGIYHLEVRESECKFCYPKSNAYAFHNPETGEFLIRYVFAYEGETVEGESIFRVEQCENSRKGILFKKYLESL